MMHKLLNRRWIFVVSFIVLVISLVYFVVFQLTFQAICIALTLTTGLVAYSYSNGSQRIDIPYTPNASSAAWDAYETSLSQKRLVEGSELSEPSPVILHTGKPILRHRGVYTNDRTESRSSDLGFSWSGDSSPNSSVMGQFTQRNLGAVAGLSKNYQSFSLTKTVDHSNWNINSDPSESFDYASSQSVSYIPSSSTTTKHLENGNIDNRIVSSNVIAVSKQPLMSGGNNSQAVSSGIVLPKFRCRVRSDVANPGVLHVGQQVSHSTANEISTHPTHQPQYGSLGILPSVHLAESPQSTSNDRGSRSFTNSLVTVKIAPPDPLREPLLFLRSESVPELSLSTTSSSTVDVLNSLTERRKRIIHEDETEETDHYSLTLNKRRKTDGKILWSDLSTYSMVNSSVGSLKRPALSSVVPEAGSAKLRRLLPPEPSSSTIQPGASARNPVEASYSSSNRWLSRKASPEVDRDARLSQSPSAEHELQSTVRYRSKTYEIMRKSYSESQMRGLSEETRTLLKPSGRSSVIISQPSVGRNSPVDAHSSREKGCTDDKSVNRNSSGVVANNRSLSRGPTTSLKETSEVVACQQLADYKVHLTNEDVENDRQKERERIKYMLGEVSDLAEDKEPQEMMSSTAALPTPTSVILPQVTTSVLEPVLPIASSTCQTSGGVEYVSSAASDVKLHSSVGAVVTDMQPEESTSLVLSTRVSGSSESTGSQFVSTASGQRSGSERTEVTSVASVASTVISTQFTSASPLRSAGFELGAESSGCFKFDFTAFRKAAVTAPESVPSSGGFRFESLSKTAVTTSESVPSSGGFRFESLSKAAVTASAAVFSNGRLNFESSQTPLMGGFKFSSNGTKAGSGKGEKSGFQLPEFAISSAASSLPNKESFSFGLMKTETQLFVSQPSLATTAPAVNVSGTASQATFSLSEFATQQNLAQFKPALAVVPGNSNFHVATLVPESTASISKDAILATNQTPFGMIETKSSSRAPLDFLNDMTKSQASIALGIPTGVKTSFSGMLGSSASNNFDISSTVKDNHGSTSSSTLSFTSPNLMIPANNLPSSMVSFGSPLSVNHPGTTPLSLISFSSPPSVNAGNQPASTISFANPMNFNSVTSPESSMISFGNPSAIVASSLSGLANQFQMQTSSAPGFAGPTSTSGLFANQQLNSSNAFGSLPQAAFKFDNQAASANVFGSNAAPVFSFGSLSNNTTAQTPGFVGAFNPSASNTVESKPFGNSPGSGNQNSFFSGPAATFQFNQNNGNSSGSLNSMPTPGSTSLFNFGGGSSSQTSNSSFNFGQNLASGFSLVQNNSQNLHLGRFALQMGQFSPPLQFAPKVPFTPRFSIGTESSNTPLNKNRLLQRSRRDRKCK